VDDGGDEPDEDDDVERREDEGDSIERDPQDRVTGEDVGIIVITCGSVRDRRERGGKGPCDLCGRSGETES
jgi:hypothetical protein